ncbi:hypothetical protein OF001_U40127 [Pseudomonas sp. OF001]|nr:hypothetical protein OF001_U40127 [Pseudomonas sp. OF001]
MPVARRAAGTPPPGRLPSRRRPASYTEAYARNARKGDGHWTLRISVRRSPGASSCSASAASARGCCRCCCATSPCARRSW